MPTIVHDMAATRHSGVLLGRLAASSWAAALPLTGTAVRHDLPAVWQVTRRGFSAGQNRVVNEFYDPILQPRVPPTNYGIRYYHFQFQLVCLVVWSQ